MKKVDKQGKVKAEDRAEFDRLAQKVLAESKAKEDKPNEPVSKVVNPRLALGEHELTPLQKLQAKIINLHTTKAKQKKTESVLKEFRDGKLTTEEMMKKAKELSESDRPKADREIASKISRELIQEEGATLEKYFEDIKQLKGLSPAELVQYSQIAQLKQKMLEDKKALRRNEASISDLVETFDDLKSLLMSRKDGMDVNIPPSGAEKTLTEQLLAQADEARKKLGKDETSKLVFKNNLDQITEAFKFFDDKKLLGNVIDEDEINAVKRTNLWIGGIKSDLELLESDRNDFLLEIKDLDTDEEREKLLEEYKGNIKSIESDIRGKIKGLSIVRRETKMDELKDKILTDIENINKDLEKQIELSARATLLVSKEAGEVIKTESEKEIASLVAKFNQVREEIDKEKVPAKEAIEQIDGLIATATDKMNNEARKDIKDAIAVQIKTFEKEKTTIIEKLKEKEKKLGEIMTVGEKLAGEKILKEQLAKNQRKDFTSIDDRKEIKKEIMKKSNLLHIDGNTGKFKVGNSNNVYSIGLISKISSNRNKVKKEDLDKFDQFLAELETNGIKIPNYLKEEPQQEPQQEGKGLKKKQQKGKGLEEKKSIHKGKRFGKAKIDSNANKLFEKAFEIAESGDAQLALLLLDAVPDNLYSKADYKQSYAYISQYLPATGEV